MRLPLPYSLKTHVGVFIAGLIFGALLGLYLSHAGGKSKPLASIDSEIAKHDVKTEAPVKALDKPALQKRGVIAKDITQDEKKEVLATGTIKDSSGTRNIAAALDVKTGETKLVQNRPFAEWMHSNALGIGIGYGSQGLRKEVFYRHKFARLWELYPQFGAAIGRNETDRSDWLLRIDLTYEW